MSREVALARCRNCSTVGPLIRYDGHYETVCTHCGHMYRVPEQDIRWIAVERWPLAAALLGTRPTAFVTREAPEMFDQGTPWR